MNINERILYIIKLKGYSKHSFCVKTDIKPQTLHHIISGRKTKPSFNVIEKIATTFVDLNIEWLITGSGEPIIEKLEKISLISEQTEDYNILCSECKCRDYKVLEMAKKTHYLRQQITELQKDKEDLRTALKIFNSKFNNRLLSSDI